MIPAVRLLRPLQVLVLGLTFAGSVAWVILAGLGIHGLGSLLLCAVLSNVGLAVLFTRIARAARALGGPLEDPSLALALACVFLPFIAVPLCLHRAGQTVSATVDDERIGPRATRIAWLHVAGVVFGVVFGAPSSSLLSLVLLGIGTEILINPLVEHARSLAPVGAVDAGTPAAIRSL